MDNEHSMAREASDTSGIGFVDSTELDLLVGFDTQTDVR
jgi:hypothetical protein